MLPFLISSLIHSDATSVCVCVCARVISREKKGDGRIAVLFFVSRRNRSRFLHLLLFLLLVTFSVEPRTRDAVESEKEKRRGTVAGAAGGFPGRDLAPPTAVELTRH